MQFVTSTEPKLLNAKSYIHEHTSPVQKIAFSWLITSIKNNTGLSLQNFERDTVLLVLCEALIDLVQELASSKCRAELRTTRLALKRAMKSITFPKVRFDPDARQKCDSPSPPLHTSLGQCLHDGTLYGKGILESSESSPESSVSTAAGRTDSRLC